MFWNARICKDIFRICNTMYSMIKHSFIVVFIKSLCRVRKFSTLLLQKQLTNWDNLCSNLSYNYWRCHWNTKKAIKGIIVKLHGRGRQFVKFWQTKLHLYAEKCTGRYFIIKIGVIMYIQNNTYKSYSEIFLSIYSHIFIFVIKLIQNRNTFLWIRWIDRQMKPLLRQLLDR